MIGRLAWRWWWWVQGWHGDDDECKVGMAMMMMSARLAWRWWWVQGWHGDDDDECKVGMAMMMSARLAWRWWWWVQGWHGDDDECKVGMAMMMMSARLAWRWWWVQGWHGDDDDECKVLFFVTFVLYNWGLICSAQWRVNLFKAVVKYMFQTVKTKQLDICKICGHYTPSSK